MKKRISGVVKWSLRKNRPSEFNTEKAMAPHSSTLAWKIPWMEEPGKLQSMGSQRVEHSWATSLSLFTFMHWRRKWQPTPVFLSGESQGCGSLVGCRLWGLHRVGHDWSDLAAAANLMSGYYNRLKIRWIFLKDSSLSLVISKHCFLDHLLKDL